MNFFDAIILSIIEGITEFLPISSTGHMVLASKILAIPQTDFVKTFEIAIQSGAIVAVVLIYGKSLLNDTEKFKKIIVAFIPTGILGFILYKFVKDVLIGNTTVTLWALFLGGLAIMGLETYLVRKTREITIEKLTYKKSFLIGIFQSISMIPGVSRSAATIIGAMLLGMSRQAAVEFSFMLAIPTMLAATGFDLLRSFKTLHVSDLPILLIGFLVTFLVAFIVVKWFLKFVQTNSLFWFGAYRIILAAAFFLLIR